MVHFPGLARTRLWIQRAVIWFYQKGFPHSEISGSRPVCGSPKLIAAYHVLLRLLAPRHPPYALSSLTIKLTQRVSTLSESKALTFAGGGLAIRRPKKFRVQFASDSSSKCIDERSLGGSRAWTSSPFHIALLSSKTCGFHGNAPSANTSRFRFVTADAYFLQLSKNFVPLIYCRPERLRSRRSAVPIWSRRCDLYSSEQQKTRRRAPG
jgi:hypothetical protein